MNLLKQARIEALESAALLCESEADCWLDDCVKYGFSDIKEANAYTLRKIAEDIRKLKEK